jgi:O-antigen/teichoic acid export membrane protein
VVNSVVTVFISHRVVADRRDRFAWDRDAARFLFHFGKWIFLSTMLTFLVGQSDRLIFGMVIPLATLGVYSIATIFAGLPTGILHRVGTAVVFPAFSRKMESMSGLKSAYQRFRRPLLALGGVAVACLAASGPALIETLYDPRYAEAGWILQLLSIRAWFHILQVPSNSALLALGLPRWLAAGNAFKLVGILAFVPLGFWWYGFPGAIGGFVASETFRYAVFTVGAHRQGLPAVWGDLLASPLVAVAAGAGLYAGLAIGQAGGGSLERLAGSVLTASLAWLPVSYVLLRRDAARFASELRSALVA